MIALLLAALASSFTCPRGSWLSSGVQPDGSFACWTWPAVTTAGDASEHNDVAPLRVEHHRIFCRRGAVPILELDGRTVRCRHLGPSA